jgi:UDP-3-O-[3-hydroxymyristoyl] N-acetylglucosamine deacetylase
METQGVLFAAPKNRVLIVDDEESIRHTLQDVLRDEGYETILARDGVEALGLIETGLVDLVILDIWLTGKDGMETLKEIRHSRPDLPVIMMSGHASISTAMQATKLGATDFIEKPLDLHSTLAAIRRALSTAAAERKAEEHHNDQGDAGDFISGPGIKKRSDLQRDVFENMFWPGKEFLQKTLKNSALLYGQGLHSGKKSGLILEPLPENSGIHFMAVDGDDIVPAHVRYVQSTGFATTLRLGQTQVSTIEHLLSALRAYGVTNLLVKCNGEVPVLDGSARDFCALFEETGIVEQGASIPAIRVPHRVSFGEGRETIHIDPCEDFIIDYSLDYPAPLGKQHFVFELSDIESYKKEISLARTFGFVKDIGHLQKMGLAQGGRFDNFVLYGSEGAINDTLRYPDEAVRHKILDAIGDLYLLGRPIQGKVTACMTGHSDNIRLLEAILAAVQAP